MNTAITAARHTAKHNRCKECWASLIVLIRNKKVVVVCGNDDTHDGFVSNAFVDRKQQQGLSDRMEAYYHLSDILDIAGDKKTAEELLTDLGF